MLNYFVKTYIRFEGGTFVTSSPISLHVCFNMRQVSLSAFCIHNSSINPSCVTYQELSTLNICILHAKIKIASPKVTCKVKVQNKKSCNWAKYLLSMFYVNM